MDFDYFYGDETESFNFYMLPKKLFIDPRFKDLSDSAKILYSLLLDRSSLSKKNNLVDECSRVYIYFSVKELCELLNKSKPTIINILRDLDKIGLIKRKKQGQGKFCVIYVMNFSSNLNDENKPSIREKIAEAQHDITDEDNLKKNSQALDTTNNNSNVTVANVANDSSNMLELSKISLPQNSGKEIIFVNLSGKNFKLPEVKNFNLSNTEINNTKNIYSESQGQQWSNLNLKNIKRKFGTYGNVFLTEDEYQALKREIEYIDDLIERMSCYLQLRQGHYYDYAAALKMWFLKDKQQKLQKQSQVNSVKQYQRPKKSYTFTSTPKNKDAHGYQERHYDKAFYEKLMKGSKEKVLGKNL